MSDEIVVESSTGALKGQKAERYDLVPSRFERELALHFGRSAKEHGGKYEARNWEKGCDWSSNYAALRRHLRRWWEGEDDDDEGFPHLIAVAWHAACLYEYSFTHPEMDDRPVPIEEQNRRSIKAGMWTGWQDAYEAAQERIAKQLARDLVCGEFHKEPERPASNGPTTFFTSRGVVDTLHDMLQVGDQDDGSVVVCENGMTYTFVESPRRYGKQAEHDAWVERQKQRCDDWSTEWHRTRGW